MVNVPQFDYPFRFGTDGQPVVIEQNDIRDVMICVTAAAKTERGTRFYVPNFGIDDPTFKEMPLDGPTIEAQLRESEPRSNILTTQQISDLVDNLTVEVDPIG